MSSIAFQTSIATRGCADEAPKSYFRKICEHWAKSRQARAEKHVALYLSTHGGVLNDDMEREIMALLSDNVDRQFLR